MLPFLKWAGGKRWLSSTLYPIVQECKGIYFEPFLGSGAVFLNSLPKAAFLSDTNGQLIECYIAIRDQYKNVEYELLQLAKLSPITSYYDIRHQQPDTSAKRAARFLYLNRTCWNGLYRVNLKGEFNVPRGTKTQVILASDNFARVSAALQSVDIRIADFEESIDLAQDGDMIFADPPYTVAHNLNGFVKYNQTIFSWDDQLRLAGALAAAADRGATVIATNADHPDIHCLYEDRFFTKPLSRASIIAASSSKRRTTTELFITSRPVTLP